MVSKRSWSPWMVRMVEGQADFIHKKPDPGPSSSSPCIRRSRLTNLHHSPCKTHEARLTMQNSCARLTTSYHSPCSIHHATFTVYHSAQNIHHATCTMQDSSEATHRARATIQYLPCNIYHAPFIMYHSPCRSIRSMDTTSDSSEGPADFTHGELTSIPPTCRTARSLSEPFW